MWDESASWAEPAGAVTTATWVKLPFVDSRRSMCLPTHVGLLSTYRAKRHGHGRQADLAMRLRVEGVGDGTVQPTGNEVLRRGAFITRLSGP